MKKILKFGSLLLGLFLLAGGLTVGEHKVIETKAGKKDWTQITSVSDLNDTDYFIITDKDNDKNDPAVYFNGTVNSGHFKTTAFSNENPAYIDAAGIVQFTEISNGVYTIKELSTGKYLRANKAGSGGGELSESDSNGWLINCNSGHFDAIYQVAYNSKYAALRAYNTTDFRTYSNNDSTLVTTSSGTSFHIYKYEYKDEVFVTGVTLDVTEKTILIGESFDLNATIAPDNATEKGVTWTSSNEEIATVTDGRVEALAVGETTITVTTTDGEFTATCKVKVEKNPYIYDTLTKASLNLGSGYTKYTNKELISSAEYFLYVTTNGNNIQSNKNSDATKHYGIVTTKTGGLAKSVTVTFADNNSNPYEIYGSNVAYTDPDNLYSAETKGTLIEKITESKTVEITGDYQYLGFYSPSGANYIAEIKVKWDPVIPTSIEANDSLELTIGGTETIAYELVNGDFVVSETDVEFTSDNSAVSVSETGVVTGVSAGTANVTIKSKADENVTKTIAVTVSATKTPVTSVTLDQTELVIKETHTEELVATVLPEEASIKTVTWSSSDETVATVDKDGKVTGVKAGTATIKVESTDDDTKYAECAVTVEKREVVQFAKAETTTALIEGGKYIIVGEKDGVSYVMAHYVSGNSNVKSSDAELNTKNTIPVAIKEDIEDCFYTLVANDDGTWSFFDGEKYLYAAGTGTNNYMKTTTTIDGKAKFAITFDNSGLVSVIAQDDTVNANLRFNKGNELFSCYGVDGDGNAKMDQIYLYGVVENQNTASALAQNFMIQTNLVCSGEADVDRSQPLASMWDGFKESYQALEIEEKGKFLEATPSALIEAMLKRYDYIVAKYSLENFITGHKVSPLNNRVYYVGKQNNDSAVAIITIVSVVSVTCLGVLITIKKRKTINK